ncbi:MAG: hypothetical protein ABI220_00185 [Candidatus Saccharimonadales bacterium]
MAIAGELIVQSSTDLQTWESELDEQPEPCREVEDYLQQEASEFRQLGLERISRAKAEKFIGMVATGAEVEVGITHDKTPRNTSLLDSIRAAASGDQEALRSVTLNVKTDFMERSIKAGHVTQINQSVDSSGHIEQHGQTGQSIQANSLRYTTKNPKMRPRVEAETRNLFRLEEAYREGLLTDYCVVVPSRPPDNMSDSESHNEGFFIDTMSIALQSTTVNETGQLVTESAFVAGKHNRSAPRQDRLLVQYLGDQLDIDTDTQSASEGIDRPWLISKSLMPNGVIDLVRIMDEFQGTFFGLDRPSEDYLSYVRECEARERELDPTIQEIVTELLRGADELFVPLDATRRLHAISENKLVRRALYDEKIDTTVLGIESAYYVQSARNYMELGDLRQAEVFMQKAETSADTSSCPGTGTGLDVLANDVVSSGQNNTSSESGNCEFTSKECPICHKKKVHTVVKRLASGKKFISGSCGCSTVA